MSETAPARGAADTEGGRLESPYPPLRLAIFRFTLEAQETLYLPPYKGSTLRGGLGYVFKRSVCAQPQKKHCDGCLLIENCAYAYLFETHPPSDSDALSTHRAIPRPFVIEPPLDQRTEVPAGQRLSFRLVLIGRAIQHLPYFLVAARELGETGLGSKRGRYILRDVTSVEPISGEEAAVYDGEELVGTGLEVTAQGAAAWADRLPPDQLTLRFLTPARLKHEGTYARTSLAFHVLARALLRRLSSMAYFHCGEAWETDYAGWVARAEGVEARETNLRWGAWERYSGRQRRRIDMGGVVGSVTYTGDLAPFHPLLALGQWVHVGKATVFGNGLYRVVDGRKSSIEGG